eukprot:2149480-Pleurochrysis_carterae.AAC.4
MPIAVDGSVATAMLSSAAIRQYALRPTCEMTKQAHQLRHVRAAVCAHQQLTLGLPFAEFHGRDFRGTAAKRKASSGIS